jgi:NAD(P)-dependent dehydrogenase (short-subunit alcohol dehydrogenase family)
MRLGVVTGGTRGIGRAVADRLAADGWDVLVLARRPAGGHRFAACDVADPASVAAAFAGLARVDALVNCAGIAGANRLDGDDALWHAIIASNLHGTYHACKAVLPKLPDGTGRIVNIASVLGLRGVPDQTAYCAAKHGVVGFTEMARQRYGELGITAEQAAAGVPTGRIATPQEVADAVAWLLRPEARGITGHALPVDGGGLALP